MSEAQGFFSRWARRKAEAGSGVVRPDEAPLAAPLPPATLERAAVPAAVAAAPVQAALEETAPVDVAPAEPVPTLDDVASLAPGDEVSRFVARGVDEAVKRAAVKKLFTDPHFNIMDGLDIYIDDYSRPDPIPAAMLRQMNQSHALGLFADEDEKAVAPVAAPTLAPAPTTLPAQDADPAASADGIVPPTDDEDADLQLQPDDAARRPGADQGTGPGGV